MYQQFQTQNYGYQQPYQVGRPTYTNNAMTFSGLKGRPVASFEEARASMIEFDGSIFYFPDLANKCIYTKQINMDGTALINVYELKEIPIQQEQAPSIDFNNFVTKDELNQAITQLREALSAVSKSEVSPLPEVAPAADAAPLALNF